MVAFLFYKLNENKKDIIQKSKYNKSNIRATYPVYSNMDKNKALKIFAEYHSAKTSYKPFIAYRREGYNGVVTNIDSNLGIRTSTNHSLNDSVWFLGGSTMWGTGTPDDMTIPSYFAKFTKEKVLNLGESGYSSFQELINLQLMLLKGYKPNRVIFYDGQNDGYRYCQKNEPVPSHAYYSRYLEMINSYKSVKRKAMSNIKQKENIIKEIDIFQYINIKSGNYFSKVYGFLNSPFIFFNEKNNIRQNKSLAIGKPIKDFKKKNDYLTCTNEKNAKTAAEATVFSWLSAYQLLSKNNIKVNFILQPTAVYLPERYNLDYMINTMKQRIVDEADNYAVYYNAVRNEWKKQCGAYNACETFIDLSEIFFDNKEALFIDNCHLGPKGNKIVAQKLLTYLNN